MGEVVEVGVEVVVVVVMDKDERLRHGVRIVSSYTPVMALTEDFGTRDLEAVQRPDSIK